ncbi:MAG TPA: purine-nucleoside phosphorylase [Flavobacteriales bacterium]|nr:purine-nucleoside phosphorylase [Flavobacteriales bacterium]
MLKKIKSIVEFIETKVDTLPELAIILGTGLGGLVSEIEVKTSILYEDIPGFPVSTVDGHSGRLIFGKIGSKNVVAMQGRFHYYEGYTFQELAIPVRVMKFLGIKHLFVSNACGGVNPNFEIGDLMIIDDHVNLLPGNPLIGQNYNKLGPRFPDMSEPYDSELIEKAIKIAADNDITAHTGTYAVVSGPCLETPAEYRYIFNIGADAVGMSTVPEVITARHMGIPCFAISVITDLGVPGKIVLVTHEDVQHVAEEIEPKLTLLIKELIGTL